MVKKRIPKTIGTYTVHQHLGEGGMGEVLLGEHSLLGRPVAIKRLLSSINKDEEMRARFIHEGQVLSKLQHHSICAIYDFVQKASSVYMVLEYVDGFDLHSILKSKEALPLDIAVSITLQVAEALDHAHYHQILHRDIKPANVMISRAGEIKLMDFGIALSDNYERMTKTGLMVGTPHYMAPEIILGEEAKQQSDIYSLGAMFYQLLSGQKMFAHANQQNIFMLISQGKFPALSKIKSGIPRKLHKILNKCTTLKPNQRYRYISELKHDLEEFLLTFQSPISEQERLVGFLYNRGFLGRAEALTLVDEAQFQTATRQVLKRNKPQNLIFSKIFLSIIMIIFLSIILKYFHII